MDFPLDPSFSECSFKAIILDPIFLCVANGSLPELVGY